MSDKLKPTPGGEAAAYALPEVEFALALSRTINALREDPAQLRYTVYEQARIALSRDILQGDPEERARLSQALETAIVGVERFASRQDDSHAPPSHRLAPSGTTPLPPAGRAVMHYSPEDPSPANRPPVVFDLDEARSEPIRTILDVSPLHTKTAHTRRSGRIKMFVGIGGIFAALIVSAIAARQLLSSWNPQNAMHNGIAGQAVATKQADGPPPQIAAEPTVPKPSVPLPTTYGAYALNNGQLVELSLLDGLVPDKRVAIASPFQTPARTVLADGSPTFVIFRRDLASIPSDDIEVRVVAHISRTMKFDSSAKSSPNYAKEDQLWSIRGIAYKFKAAPVPGYPEIMVLRSESPDAALPPGRYALVLKRQGYDFTVPGAVTDPNHCLERTEAANGTFYSPCSKAP